MSRLQTFRDDMNDVTIYAHAHVLNRADVDFGQHVIVDDFVFIGAHRSITIGSYVHIASHVSLTGGGDLYLSDFSNISTGTRILTGTDDFLGTGLIGPTVPAEFRKVTRGRVLLQRHVILGANTVVLPNVTIGEGTAVGAGTIVTRDLDPWSIYVGAPARKVGERARDSLLAAERRLLATYGPLAKTREGSSAILADLNTSG